METMGWREIGWKSFLHSFRWFQLRQFCTVAAFTDGPAWICRKSDPRMRFAHAAPGMTNGMLGLR
ncbi:hypothetical protein D3Y55_12830 [Mesorhizobium sp. DCY119]|nr:hypothetical protein D3Y55_12830 [Mesorhizobium sp. DCY119]